MVLTQSCDLEVREGRRPQINVLLAPAYALPDWLAARPEMFGTLEGIRKGYSPEYYLVPPCSPSPAPAAQSSRVVAFSALVSVPFAQVVGWVAAGHRAWSLRSPQREHFGQAVARYFMRVGLPIAVAEFRWLEAGVLRQESLQMGSSLWPGGPVVSRQFPVRFQQLENGDDKGPPERLVRAELKVGGQTARGYGRNSDQALESLLRFIKAQHDALAAGWHPAPTKYRWILDLFQRA